MVRAGGGALPVKLHTSEERSIKVMRAAVAAPAQAGEAMPENSPWPRAARDGANVAIAAKTTEVHPKLPGAISAIDCV